MLPVAAEIVEPARPSWLCLTATLNECRLRTFIDTSDVKSWRGRSQSTATPRDDHHDERGVMICWHGKTARAARRAWRQDIQQSRPGRSAGRRHAVVSRQIDYAKTNIPCGSPGRQHHGHAVLVVITTTPEPNAPWRPRYWPTAAMPITISITLTGVTYWGTRRSFYDLDRAIHAPQPLPPTAVRPRHATAFGLLKMNVVIEQASPWACCGAVFYRQRDIARGMLVLSTAAPSILRLRAAAEMRRRSFHLYSSSCSAAGADVDCRWLVRMTISRRPRPGVAQPAG